MEAKFYQVLLSLIHIHWYTVKKNIKIESVN